MDGSLLSIIIVTAALVGIVLFQISLLEEKPIDLQSLRSKSVSTSVALLSTPQEPPPSPPASEHPLLHAMSWIPKPSVIYENQPTTIEFKVRNNENFTLYEVQVTRFTHTGSMKLELQNISYIEAMEPHTTSAILGTISGQLLTNTEKIDVYWTITAKNQTGTIIESMIFWRPITIKVETDAVIIFDKPEYGPFDTIEQIKIIYPPANEDPSKIDRLFTTLSTTSGNSKTLRFNEIAKDSSVFVSYPVKLTPYPALWYGDFIVQKNDDLILEFTIDNQTFTEKASINFHKSAIKMNKDAFNYASEEKMEIIVWDLDMNKNRQNIDIIPVTVWSTTDPKGLIVVLKEMGTNSGMFHGFVTFTVEKKSSGIMLRVSDGDTAIARYMDNTLTSAKPNSNEVEELFASALISGPCVLCPPLERATSSEPELFKLDGSKEFEAGDQIIIKTELASSYATLRKKTQPFACIIQVKNSENVVLSLSWVEGELRPKQSMNVETNWIPESSGEYTIEIFTWESVDKPEALGPVRTALVTVTE